MSADNWTTCPRCMALDMQREQELEEKARCLYGKIPVEEWRNLQAKKEFRLGNDLREDFSVGVRGNVFSVTYKAKCRSCGFKFAFDHKVDLSEYLSAYNGGNGK